MNYLIEQLVRFKNTIIWSLKGLYVAWSEEISFRQWTTVNLFSIALALVLDLTTAERALVIGFGLLVLVAELANTAIELTVDRISKERHPTSGKAKDVGSAMVAMSALAAFIVWLLVLIG